VYLSLGSNVGDRLGLLSKAVQELESLPESDVQEVSSVYETEPIGYKEQADFLNMAVALQTSLSPMALFTRTKQIEKALGRHDQTRWQPREIDIDILLYDQLIFRSERLFIPHREMLKRKFVLVPLSEIAGSAIHPVEKIEVQALLRRCKDTSRVTRTEIELTRI
jgi:2-amino-4-hydroxy-6-hydroxymethyldihydropteridine diphosphokinase